MNIVSVNPLEKRLAHLELVVLDSMKASVADFYRRIPPKADQKSPWRIDAYPTGDEKELYAQFAHIVLSAPATTIPAMLRLFGTSTAEQLLGKPLLGHWRGYRISTIRFRLGSGWEGPMCLLGTSDPGSPGAIADVGLFLNPDYDVENGVVRAETILFFEIKSAPHHRYSRRQIEGHMAALEQHPSSPVAFLAALGGRRIAVDHPQWLGHATWDEFLGTMSQAIGLGTSNSALVDEIEELRISRSRQH